MNFQSQHNSQHQSQHTLPRRMGRTLATSLLALAGVFQAASATAQEIELYDQSGFRGTRLRLIVDMPDAAAFGLGGRIASVFVRSGQWEFCTAAQYTGACITVGPGRYAEMPAALRGTLASARRADTVAVAAPAPAPAPPPPAPIAPAAPVSPPAPAMGAPGYVVQTSAWGALATADAVILFQHVNFVGRQVALSTSIANLNSVEFNDQASSVIINRGRWQFCEHADFRGACIILGPGRHTLGGNANDKLTSLRPLFGKDDRPLPQTGGIALYDNADYTGRQLLFVEAIANLRPTGLNDRASAIDVFDGQWEICTDADFKGLCVIIPPGRYVLDANLNDKISSLRPR